MNKRMLWEIIYLTFILCVLLLQRISFIGEILISPWPIFIFGGLIFILICTIFSFKKKKVGKELAFQFLCLLAILPFVLNIIVFYYSSPGKLETDNFAFSSSLKLMSVNIYIGNKDYASIADSVKRNSPDIIMFYEISPEQREGIRALLPEYVYELKSSPDYNGVLSKIPLTSVEHIPVDMTFSFVKVLLNKDGVEYVIYGIHPPALLGDDHIQTRTKYINKLVYDIGAEPNLNVVIAGDYNMSPWVWGYQDMMQKLPYKFNNAGQGTGFYNTWGYPIGLNLPLTTIDHILVSQSLLYSEFKTEWINGSDHRALFVQVYPL